MLNITMCDLLSIDKEKNLTSVFYLTIMQVLALTVLVLDGLETINYRTAHLAHHRNTGPVSFICVNSIKVYLSPFFLSMWG